MKVVKKKSGITVIETIVALLIIMIVIPIATTLVSATNNSFAIRKSKNNINIISYCVIEELKYNYTIDEIKSELVEGKIALETGSDFLEKIRFKDLFTFNRGNNIEIRLGNKISEDSLYIL